MPEPRKYDFNERLTFSNGVCATADVGTILLSQIPGAVAVEKANGTDDRNGTDWWVCRSSLRKLSVDAKIRGEDWSAKQPPWQQDDLALETWSVVENQVVGWTRNKSKETDYVLWLWIDTGRWCLVPFCMLCAIMESLWKEWKTKFKTVQQVTGRTNGTKYHSECVFVPRREVWRELYLRFSGDPRSIFVDTVKDRTEDGPTVVDNPKSVQLSLF